MTPRPKKMNRSKDAPKKKMPFPQKPKKGGQMTYLQSVQVGGYIPKSQSHATTLQVGNSKAPVAACGDQSILRGLSGRGQWHGAHLAEAAGSNRITPTYCHVPQTLAKKNASSHNAQLCAHAMQLGREQSYSRMNGMRMKHGRDKAKKMKIRKMKDFRPQMQQIIESFTQGNIFFKGSIGGETLKVPPNSRVIPATTLAVMAGPDCAHHANQGFTLWSKPLSPCGRNLNGAEIVCRLIPRTHSVPTFEPLASDLIAALEAVQEHKNPLKRADSKKPRTEHDDSNTYHTVGQTPHRTQPKVFISGEDDVPPEHWGTIQNFLLQMDKLCRQFIESDILRGYRYAKRMGKWGSFFATYGFDDVTISCSLAFGKNVYLPAHYDQDFFFSFTIVIPCSGKVVDVDTITHYFCFPEQHRCAAMRPFDTIIFDPTVAHCISSKTENAGDHFCLSTYVKTATASGHNNKIKLEGLKRALYHCYKLEVELANRNAAMT